MGALTETTADIAEHLAARIWNNLTILTQQDLEHLIERELDKYVDEGTVRIERPQR